MLFEYLRSLFPSGASAVSHTADTAPATINPATGLPMLDNSMVGVDVGGSPFGLDIHSSSSGFDSGLSSNPWD